MCVACGSAYDLLWLLLLVSYAWGKFSSLRMFSAETFSGGFLTFIPFHCALLFPLQLAGGNKVCIFMYLLLLSLDSHHICLFHYVNYLVHLVMLFFCCIIIVIIVRCNLCYILFNHIGKVIYFLCSICFQ